MKNPLHNEIDLSAYWMPFTGNRAFKNEPRLMKSAQGLYYTTIDDRQIMDGMSGLWCCNAGHCHPHIVEAIRQAAGELDYSPAFQMGHSEIFRLAERIAAMMPEGMEAVFFTNSGSESVDTALKIALGYHHARGEGQRTRLVGRQRGYHGSGFGGTSVGGIGNNRTAAGPLLPGVFHLPETYDAEHQAFSKGQPSWGAHLANDLERIIASNHASTIAAVIVEPFAGSGGVLVPPVGYLERLREITEAHGVLLIFDEVITAFGRLGWGSAAERLGVVPDIICTAKGLTSGTVPMGAVVVQEKLREAFMKGPPTAIEFFHGYTYSGHPLAAAAAHATLDVYENESLFQHVRGLESTWEEGLHALADKPHVIDVRNFGLAGAVELRPQNDAPTERAMAVFREAFDRGLLVRTTGDIVALAPPLVIDKTEIGRMLGILGEVLDDID
ncbi:MAG: aspartate aminotransferase family protein [Pseudomonadota bacterium]|nr:aspartate aminotransferase family protein [Pseudomonadota bacterium]